MTFPMGVHRTLTPSCRSMVMEVIYSLHAEPYRGSPPRGTDRMVFHYRWRNAPHFPYLKGTHEERKQLSP